MLVILLVFKVRLTTYLQKLTQNINYISASVKEVFCDSYLTLVSCGVRCVDFPLDAVTHQTSNVMESNH